MQQGNVSEIYFDYTLFKQGSMMYRKKEVIM